MTSNRRFFLILLVVSLARLLLSGFGGLHVDEAYYWLWSRHLSISYFDHPPMIAWMIALGDRVFAAVLPEFVRTFGSEFWALIGFRWCPIFVSNVAAPWFWAKL